VKLTTNVKGQIALTKAELRALELGYVPSRPIFDARYDLILDNQGKLTRIQVKYANGNPSYSEGAVIAKLEYENRTKTVFTYKKHEVDGLIVYIPKIERLCYFPNKLFVGKKKLQIRLNKPKNNQKKGIILAKDYFW